MSDTESPQKESAASLADDCRPERWLEEHGSILFRFAYLRVSDRGIAEDLVQETFIKAIENVDKFRGEASIRTWLFAILRSVLSRHFRRQKKESRAKSDSGTNLEELLHPSMGNREFRTNLEKAEFWDVVQGCFSKVPEHLLETFLHRLANPDCRIEEVCQELDIKPANFSVRLFRTRLMLRECLERYWK